MAHRVLELTLVSARDLPNVNLFSGMQVYAVASVYGDPRTRQRTLTDRDGETDPAWNHTVWFAVSPTAAAAGRAYLHVLLRTERYFAGSFGFGDRDVGEVFILVADLLAGACAAGGGTPWRCASYPVRKAQSNRHCGTLSIAYRLGPVVAPPLEPDCPAVMPPCRPARRNFNWNGHFALGLGSGLLGGGFAGTTTAAYRSR
ncbi:protein SRC2-like [Triticum dicoccoides]|uniref:protein SRC2-like n=1 Tax=Triticum dicoccoides TaxID=85692 RepID=UPI00188DE89C|nr:protein SRC2-like [Triticum dicoccoides]